MSAAPSMPMYWDAYLADTTHLSTEEHGAYLLLLAAMWRRNGSIPDADRDNARIVGLTPAKWRKFKVRIAPLLAFEDGTITQKNLQKIWKNTQEKISKNRANGSKGGRPKSNKNNETAKPNGYVSDNPNESIPEPEPKEIDKSISSAREEKSDQDCFEEAWKAYQSCKLKASAQKKKPAKDAWRAASGRCPPDQLLLAVRKAVEIRNTATGFFPALPHMHRWLQRDEWKDVLSEDGSSDGEAPPLTDDHWRSIFRTWCETGQWPTALAGPSPEAPDCRAPAEMIKTAMEWKAGRAA